MENRPDSSAAAPRPPCRRRFLRSLAAGAAIAGFLLGCVPSKPPEGSLPPPARPGRPLPPKSPAAAPAPSKCKDCGETAGPGHRCGLSVWCADCARDASPAGHGCGVSAFCPVCRREAALAGHVCGETRFCLACKAEVPRVHEHDAASKKAWGSLR